MDDTAEDVPRREAGFWASVVLAAISALLPFIPERWLGSFVIDLVVLLGTALGEGEKFDGMSRHPTGITAQMA